MRISAWMGFVAASVLSASIACAVVTPIGQFIGDFHDTFDQWNATNATASLPTFDDHGSIVRVGTDGSIKTEFSSQLGGDLVVPITDMMIGQLCIPDWIFNEPASRFGGYWESNSHADDATLQFYDTGDNLLA